jgi:NADPH2 dehydrogenase
MTTVITSWSDKLVFLLGVNTGFVAKGEPDARYVDFYRQRSSADLHCAIVGNVVIPGGYGSNRSTPTIGSNPVWAALADAIRERGTLPGIQLATVWEGYEGARTFLRRDAVDVIGGARELVRSLGRRGIDHVLRSFEAAATIAIEHGFGHIQIHAAHGYLPNLLIDKRINPAASHVLDRLGRLAEWLHAKDVETSIRISMRTGDANFDATGTTAFQDSVAALPFDFVDLSSGFYNLDKRLIYPARPEITLLRLRESIGAALRNPSRRFIVSGRIAQSVLELPRNAHIGLCRDLIANPHFLTEPDNGCRNHGKCHYYSRGREHVTCSRWSERNGKTLKR